MSAPLRRDRRRLLAAGAGLGFAFVLPRPFGAAAVTGAPAAGVDTAWVHIGTDDTVTIRVAAAEVGQGSMTAQAVIIAEELDADWEHVRIEFAPPDDETFGNPVFWAYGIMLTAGSTGIQAYYERLRLVGAQVRRVLVDAAAAYWGTGTAHLRTGPGVVVHPDGRRLTYGAVATFARVPNPLPQVTDADLKPPERFRLIGRDVRRPDVTPKVTGAAQYSIDVRLPNMVYAAVQHPPVPGTAPVAVDDATALVLPGVRAVLKLPHAVAVIGDTSAAALAAERALGIRWSAPPPGAAGDSESTLEAHAAAARDPGVTGKRVMDIGDVEGALETAQARYEAEYRTDFVYHAQLEPQNAVARLTHGGRGVEVWAGTQTPTHLVRAVAAALDVPESAVILHRTLVGGAFGSRLEQSHRVAVDAVLLARELGRPVQALWSRETDLRCGRYKPITAHYLRAGVGAGGELAAWSHRVASDEPLAQSDPYRYEHGHGYPATSSPGAEILYAVPHRRAEVIRMTAGARLSPLRGVNVTPNKFASESFLDEVATARGLDPLELRLRLLRDEPAAQEVLRIAAELAGWRRPGLGLSFVDTHGTFLATIAEVSVDERTGVLSVPNIWAVMDPGTVVQPRNALAQLEGALVFGLSNALKERVTTEDGAVRQSNFHDYPVLGMAQMPAIHARVIASARPPSGCGEVGVMGVAPAIASAFAALTGRRLRHMPFLPERVLAALRA